MFLIYFLPIFLFSFVSVFSNEKPLKVDNYVNLIPAQDHLSNYRKIIPALLYSDDVIRILYKGHVFKVECMIHDKDCLCEQNLID